MKQALEVVQLLLAFSILLNLWQQFEELVRKWATRKNFLGVAECWFISEGGNTITWSKQENGCDRQEKNTLLPLTDQLRGLPSS